MKKLFFILLLSQLLLLTACEDKTTFSGESEDWRIQSVSSASTKNIGYFDLLINKQI